MGKKLKDFPELVHKKLSYVTVKEAIFPFNMFPEVDPILGPEMRATGEVMGIDRNFGVAYYKAQESVGMKLPLKGNVLITVADKDKKDVVPIAKKLLELGFNIFSTENTHRKLEEGGVKSTIINKVHEGRPNLSDTIKNREIHLIINTPIGRTSVHDDSYIRILATQYKIPYVTTMAAARATVDGIAAVKKNEAKPLSLQEYHAALKEGKSAETLFADTSAVKKG